MMSYAVSTIVRNARLPRTLKRRPLAKAVLHALADRCEPDGTNARPSLARIASEVEIGRRTTARVLAALCDEGLIVEQAAATQHRPTVWCLNVARLIALADTHDHAPLDSPDTHDHALLDAPSDTHDRAPLQNPGAHIRTSDAHAVHSDTHDRAHDPVLMNSPMNIRKNAAAPPAHPVENDNALTDDEVLRLSVLAEMRRRHGGAR